MSRDLLHQLLGTGHPGRPDPQGLQRQRCLFGVARTGARVVLSVRRVEQLGNRKVDDGIDIQQETCLGATTVQAHWNIAFTSV